MRLLVVLWEFPDLSETFVMDQIIGLINRGFTVDILAARPKAEAVVHSDVAAYRLMESVRYANPKLGDGDRLLEWMRMSAALVGRGRFRLLMELLAGGLRRKLKRPFPLNDRFVVSYAAAMETLPVPDVILCHFGPFGDLMVRIRKALGARWPLATFFHGYDVSSVIHESGPKVYRRLLAEGEVFFPACEFFRKRLIDLGANASRTFVQRMGVRLSSKSKEHQAGRGPKDTFVVVSVGRLVEKKGHEFAIRALATCREIHPNTKFELEIIGDGPLMEKLKSLVHELNLTSEVAFAGSLLPQAVQERLLSADAFLLPSITATDGDMEASPVAISEAMVLGLPILATRHGGITEIVDHGINGILVEERDTVGLAKALCVLAHDSDAAARMGQAGREKAERELDRDRWNDLLAERIKEMGRARP